MMLYKSSLNFINEQMVRFKSLDCDFKIASKVIKFQNKTKLTITLPVLTKNAAENIYIFFSLRE